MKKSAKVTVLVVLLGGLAGAGAVRAETDYLWPTFSVGAGGYQVTATDKIRLEGSLGSTSGRLDLESDLGLPDSKTLVAVDLAWGFADRHSVELNYYSFDRDGSRSITREVEVGKTTFPVGAATTLSFKTRALEAGYTYWFSRQERFGFGGTAGVVQLGLDVKASASANIGPAGAKVTKRVDENTDLPVPMIGLAFKGSPTPRLVLYARGRLLPEVTVGDYKGEAASYTLGAYYYVAGPVALGASYDGSYFKADVDKKSWQGSVDLKDTGWRFFARAAF